MCLPLPPAEDATTIDGTAASTSANNVDHCGPEKRPSPEIGVGFRIGIGAERTRVAIMPVRI